MERAEPDGTRLMPEGHLPKHFPRCCWKRRKIRWLVSSGTTHASISCSNENRNRRRRAQKEAREERTQFEVAVIGDRRERVRAQGSVLRRDKGADKVVSEPDDIDTYQSM